MKYLKYDVGKFISDTIYFNLYNGFGVWLIRRNLFFFNVRLKIGLRFMNV